MAKSVKPISRPILKKTHKEKRIALTQKYIKTNFEDVLFTDEARATLDGPDGRAKVWLPLEAFRLHCVRDQQGDGSLMLWAGIIENELLGPFEYQ